MEYTALRGEFDDIPRALLLSVFAEHYPNLPRLDQASWDDDISAAARKLNLASLATNPSRART